MTLPDYLMMLAYVSAISVLIPIGCYFFAKTKNQLANLLLVLMLSALSTDIAVLIGYRLGYNGFAIHNAFYVVQFTVLTLIYANLLVKKRAIYLGLVGFLLSVVIDTMFYQPIHVYQTVTRGTGGVILIFFALRYFVEMHKYLPAKNIFVYFPLWLNMGVFFYFGLTLFLMIFSNYIFTKVPKEISMLIWGFHNFNNIVKNCMFATGIYVGLVKNPPESDEPAHNG